MKEGKHLFGRVCLGAGAALVSLGVGLLCRPAGCIAAGIFLLVTGVLDALGGGEDV